MLCVCLAGQLSPFSHFRLFTIPMDCRPLGSFVHGFLQARILEWVAIPFSRESSQARNQTWVSYISCIGQVGSLPAPPGKPPCLVCSTVTKKMLNVNNKLFFQKRVVILIYFYIFSFQWILLEILVRPKTVFKNLFKQIINRQTFLSCQLIEEQNIQKAPAL